MAFVVQGIQLNLDSTEIRERIKENSLSVELPMQAAGSIEVVVTKPDGSPLAGAQVST